MKVIFGALLILSSCLVAQLTLISESDPARWHWQYQEANMVIERRAFSGGDAGGGYYWYWGGGHSSYSGSDLVVYDVSRSTWRRLTSQELWIEAETWPFIYRVEPDGSLIREEPISAESLETIRQALGGGSAVPFVTPNGQPGVTHSYQQVAYWPEKKAVCLLHVSSGLWCYYQDVGGWRLLDRNAPVASLGINHHNLIHDSKRGTLMVIRDARERDLWRLENDVWVKLMDLPSFGWGTVMLEHDPVRDLLVGTYGKNGWAKIDLKTATVTPIENVPAGVKAHEWDPGTGNFIFLVKQDRQSANPVALYQYNPDTNIFLELAPSGGPPVGWVRFDLLDYDPVNDVFLFPDIQGTTPNGPVQGMWILSRAANPQETPPTGTIPPVKNTSAWVQRPLPTPELFPLQAGGKDFRMVTRKNKVYLLGGDLLEYLENGQPEPSSRGMNSILAYDPSTETWEEIAPRCPVDGVVPRRPDELPVAYDSKRDRIWIFAGYFHPDDGSCATAVVDTMYFDFADMKWHTTGVGSVYGADVGHANYDPVTDKFYAPAPRSENLMWEFDPVTMQARKFFPTKDGPDFRAWTHWSDIDVQGRRIFMAGQAPDPMVLWVYHIDENRLESLGPLPETTPYKNAWLLQWLPGIGKLVALLRQGGNPDALIHVYDPAARRWETLDPPVYSYTDEYIVGGAAVGKYEPNTVVVLGLKALIDKLGQKWTYFWTAQIEP